MGRASFPARGVLGYCQGRGLRSCLRACDRLGKVEGRHQDPRCGGRLRGCLRQALHPRHGRHLSAEVDSKFAAAIEKAEGFAASSEARIKELEAELNALNNRKNWSEVTVEEELANNPEIAAEIEHEIANNKW